MSDYCVAIVIVNYNGLGDTVECIDSLLRMKSKVKFIIYVVDNASKNDEITTIEKLYNTIVTIRSNENLGFAAGNNLAIDRAIRDGCTDVLLLNNDTVVCENFLDELLCGKKDNSILVPKMLYYSDVNTIWYGGGYINKSTGNAVHYHKNQHDGAYDDAGECEFATGCCMFIPRDVILKIGLLDETYFMYCEDVEYCLRAVTQGIHIIYIPEARLWHKVSRSTGGDDSAFSIYYMTRNRLRYVNSYKDYFKKTAYGYTLLSRYIRAFQYACRRNKNWKIFLYAIQDYKVGKIGKADRLLMINSTFTTK